jgi:molecular chaperone DnaJ
VPSEATASSTVSPFGGLGASETIRSVIGPQGSSVTPEAGTSTRSFADFLKEQALPTPSIVNPAALSPQGAQEPPKIKLEAIHTSVPASISPPTSSLRAPLRSYTPAPAATAPIDATKAATEPVPKQPAKAFVTEATTNETTKPTPMPKAAARSVMPLEPKSPARSSEQTWSFGTTMTEKHRAASEDPEPASTPADSSAAPLVGDAICYDEYGRPTIVRQINPENGQARTIVVNDNGSHRVFGEHTIASLANSNKDETKTWVDLLTSHQLRGLVHEVGQRLLEASRLYHARHNQLEKMGEDLNYIYFGLTSDASDKDLEKAWRKLARQLHPDKNGGTEAAKKRFQQMKDRYEAIKKNRNQDLECESDDGMEPQPASDKDDDGPRQLKDKKRKDKDDAESAAKEEDEADQASSIAYDPQDRDSMEKTVSKMLGQLKNIEIQMKVVVKELNNINIQLKEEKGE